jgi:hypothetical protein
MLIRFSSIFFLATSASVVFFGSGAAQESQVKVDLDRANTLLAQGRYIDAIAVYDDVIRISRGSDN